MEADSVTSREMQALETNAHYFGISRLQLMENAGRTVASEVSFRFPSRDTRIAFFCGLGGNGGDGFVAARHLLCLGYSVQLVVAGRPESISHAEALKNWQPLKMLLNQEVCEINDSSEIPELTADVAVDALLGLGLKGVPREPIGSLIKTINQMEAFRLAVDVPTGLDSDTGTVNGEAVKADLTITFHKVKLGLLKSSSLVGEILVSDIGIPNAFEAFSGPGDVGLVVKTRSSDSHKGDYGKLLVVGGSETYSGAPLLAALAALRTGVDLVYVAAPEKTAFEISSMSPNIIAIKLKGKHLNEDNVPQISQYLRKVTAAVIGPGLGLHEETKETVMEIVAAAEDGKIPLVVDADGLKAFAEFKRPLRIPAIFTPHKGEYQTLTGENLPSTLKEKTRKVKKTAAKLRTTLLLKGQPDIISDGKKVKLNFSGNPGMTVGGTGDVLTGIVGALLSQETKPFEAAVAGAFINGAAGDFVKKEKGYHMIPTDLLDFIPKIVDDPMSHLKVQKNTP
ncbi:MAG: NAD(P)H-hydrate dehydratase [Candidatus Bathyarchaeota archaeon]|nr:NAD(P)H-hydrate dehydratase [Candidatus Bathyarchaeota archaeon]